MSSAISRHPDEETLLRCVDQELADAEARSVAEHLAGCGECRDELAALREISEEIRRFHETEAKAGLPEPPRPWGRPRWSDLAKPDRGAHRVIAFPAKLSLAATAAVAAVVVVVRWMERPIQASAAELLHRAEVRERAAPNAARRIRIRWKNRSWTRPGRLDAIIRPDAGDAAVLQAMLQNAGFGWEDPLSAGAFSQWRNHLAERHDEVRIETESYVVTTSTPAGTLREASLTLRASDLHAVSATLRYRSDETLDMTEVPGDAGEREASGRPRVPVPEAIARPLETPTPAAGPAEEVRVVAALHGIGADLGEPVEVQRNSGGIQVSGTGLTASRQEQIRAAVADIPGVRVAFESGGGRRAGGTELPRRSAAPADAANPLLEQLRAASGNPGADPGDALIDATDRAVQRAYALAALARRFPAPDESELAAADRATVRSIASDHAGALSASLAQMTALLAPLLPPASTAAPDNANWQETAGNILAASRDLDQELNTASTGDQEARKARLAALLARLRSLIEAARSQLQ